MTIRKVPVLDDAGLIPVKFMPAGLGDPTAEIEAAIVAERIVQSATFDRLGFGLRACAMGDSVTNGGTIASIPQQGSRSWFNHACLQSSGRLRLLSNVAISGTTSQHIIDTQLPIVLGLKPDVCFVMTGTNDINNLWTDAVIRANVAQIVNTLIGAGIEPILALLAPRSDDVSKNTRVRQHNVWIRQYAASTRLRVVDTHSPLVDPLTGLWAAGMMENDGQGVHPSSTGARVMGAKVVSDLSGLLTQSGRSTFLPVSNLTNPNLLINGLFSTDVNADGLADNWTKSTNAVPTLGTDAEIVGKYQRLTYNGTAGGSNFQQVSSGFTGGDLLAITGKFRASASAGGMQWNIQLDFPGMTFTPMPLQLVVGLDYPTWGEFYMEMRVPAGATLIRVGMSVNQTATGYVDMAQFSMVNLTTLAAE